MIRNIIVILCIIFAPFFVYAEDEQNDYILKQKIELNANTTELTNGKLLGPDCTTTYDNSRAGITDYINIKEYDLILITKNYEYTTPNICFYNDNKESIGQITIFLPASQNTKGFELENNVGITNYIKPSYARLTIITNTESNTILKLYKKGKSTQNPENPESPQESPDLTKLTQLTTIGVGLIFAIFLTRRKV